MSEYLNNYVIDPLAGQARRLSQISQNNLNDSLVLAESFSRWSPGRLWTDSPLEEAEHTEPEDISQPAARHADGPQWNRFWRSQDALTPSPPLDPMEAEIVEEPEQTEEETPFPPLETQPAASATAIRFTSEPPHRTDSETSLNPSNELSERSRIHQDDLERGHSRSDPLSRPNTGQNLGDSIVIHGDRNTEAPDHPRGGSGTLPEDDGMAPVRNRIQAIWKGEGSNNAKSKMTHLLMMERYNTAHGNPSSTGVLGSPLHSNLGGGPLTPPPSSPGIIAAGIAHSPPNSHTGLETFQLLPSDIERTYAPPKPKEETSDTADTTDASMEEEPPRLGCKHYIRNVKPQCTTCQRYFPCRNCHDEAVKDHVLPRHATRNMLCMECLTPQPAAHYCKQCGACAGTYYCPVCKLWNSDSEKSIYHCDDCGICRLGQGLGKDFYHCPVCAVCISINVAQTHRCIEQSTKCDCPICGEYMFTSPDTVVFMRCGHSIHEACFKEWCRSAYKCPICSRSVVNMESQFRRLDRHIASQPMPDEYQDTKAIVGCNDCLHKSIVPFHWLGLRCEHCEGYNTTQLEIIGAPSLEEQQQRQPDPIETLTPEEDSAGEALANAMAQRAALIAGTQQPRPSTAVSDFTATAASPWLIPHHRGPRSDSPAITNYFGTDGRDPRRRPSAQPPGSGDAGGAGAEQNDDELEFWGGQSPRSQSSYNAFGGRGATQHDSESDDSMSDEDEDDEDEQMEDDDDEDEDHMVLFGHR